MKKTFLIVLSAENQKLMDKSEESEKRLLSESSNGYISSATLEKYNLNILIENLKELSTLISFQTLSSHKCNFTAALAVAVDAMHRLAHSAILFARSSSQSHAVFSSCFERRENSCIIME